MNKDKPAGNVVNEGDSYNIENAIGVGRSVNMQNVNITQTQNKGGDQIDLGALAAELAQLRAELKANATEPEHDMAIGAVAAAESEAKKGDQSKTLEYLSKAGNWAIDIASKIGVAVATDALKRAMMP